MERTISMHLKKEVSVKISPPNYALFYHSATPGSMHDYQRLKSTYTEYKKASR